MNAVEKPPKPPKKTKTKRAPRVFIPCVLGAMLGFVPGFVDVTNVAGGLGEGFTQAPGLVLSILALVLIIKCSLITFVIATALAKVASIYLMGISFAIGEFLLDGPLSGLFATLINAPVSAWFGFEYYATSGGLLLGLVFGSVLGYLFVKLSRAMLLRKVRAKTDGDPADAKLPGKGFPVRLIGIAIVLVTAGGLWLFQSVLSSKALKDTLRGGIEQGNGATVDMAGFDLNLQAGELKISGLALADPNALDQDIFRAGTLKMAIDTSDLLRRRFVIDNITSDSAQSGARRESPGKRIDTGTPPAPKPKTGEKTLDDYLEDAKVWEERLLQANRWIESVFRTEEGETEEEREKRIDEEIKRDGYGKIAAKHLIKGSPLVHIRNLALDNVSIHGDKSDFINIRASNLSSNPNLVDSPATISITSKQKVFGFDFKLNSKESGADADLFYNAIPVDKIAGSLKSGGKPTIAGGTIDVSMAGLLKFGEGGTRVNLPLNVALNNTTLNLKGLSPTTIDKLQLPLGISGPISAPSIKLDQQSLEKALLAAGKAELVNQLKKQADKLIGDKIPEELKGVVEGALSGKMSAEEIAAKAAEEAKKQATDAAKKEAEKLLKKNKLPGGLGDVLGGKKKDEDAAKKAAEDLLKKVKLPGLGGDKKKDEEEEEKTEAQKAAEKLLEKKLPGLGDLLGGKKKK